VAPEQGDEQRLVRGQRAHLRGVQLRGREPVVVDDVGVLERARSVAPAGALARGNPYLRADEGGGREHEGGDVVTWVVGARGAPPLRPPIFRSSPLTAEPRAA